MKNLLVIFLTIFFAIANAATTPDFSEVNKATSDFITMLETLQKELPLVNDAPSTAREINLYTKATNDLLNAMKNFQDRFPEAIKGSQPPKEFVAAYEAIQQMQTRYATVPRLIGPLVQRFRGSPDVQAAVSGLQSAVERVQFYARQANS